MCSLRQLKNFDKQNKQECNQKCSKIQHNNTLCKIKFSYSKPNIREDKSQTDGMLTRLCSLLMYIQQEQENVLTKEVNVASTATIK